VTQHVVSRKARRRKAKPAAAAARGGGAARKPNKAARRHKPAADTNTPPVTPAETSNAGDFLKIPVPTLWNPPKQGLYTRGVGGKTYFKLAVANRGRDTGRYGYDHNNAVLFEMAPARRSFFEKQGQPVPGVGAGMDLMSKANIAKLNVPGARPVYQHMGIAEERIEFVGAFIGHDEYVSHDDKPTYDTDFPDYQNAWEKSQRLAYAVRAGKEVGLLIGWEDESDNNNVKDASLSGIDHHIRFDNEHIFRGYIHSIVRTYATAHRVYYRVSMIVTNSDDMLNSKSAYGKPVPLPTVLATLAEIVPQPDATPPAGANADQAASQPVAPANPATPAPTEKPRGPFGKTPNPAATPNQDTATSNFLYLRGFNATASLSQLSSSVPAGTRKELEKDARIIDASAAEVEGAQYSPETVQNNLKGVEEMLAYAKTLPPADRKILEQVYEKQKSTMLLVKAYNYKVPLLPGTSAASSASSPKPAVSPPAARPSSPQPTPKPVPSENSNYVPIVTPVVIPNFQKQRELKAYEDRLSEFNEVLNKNPGRVYPVQTISSYKDGYNSLAREAAQATVSAVNQKLFTSRQATITSQRISANVEEWKKLAERNNQRIAQQRRGKR
jgi:hypothetical protein